MKTIATALLLALIANGQSVPQAAQVAAVQTTAAPQTTADILAAATTAAATAPATTIAPETTAAAVTAPPETTAATNPGQGTVEPPHVLPPLVPLDPGHFNCVGNTCMNRIVNVVPGQGWSFKCSGNCAGATINIDVGLDPLHPGLATNYIDAITCSEPYSCVGVTVNIMNTNQGMGVVPVELNDLRCEKPYACTGLIINAYAGVEIFNTNFDCSADTACIGCIVRDAFKLEACNANQNPNGQLMMPWEVPGTGQMPQGLTRPAHQMPMLPAYTPKNTAPPMGQIPQQFQPQQQPQQPVPQQPQQPQAQPQQPYPYFEPIQYGQQMPFPQGYYVPYGQQPHQYP